MSSKIKQAVIPAAGRGKRLLPVTKNVPKELLPLYDRPCIQHIVDEAVKAGVEEFIIIISKDKNAVKSYFEPNALLDAWLQETGNNERYDLLKQIEHKAKYKFVVQEELLGLGHAILCAEPYITDEHFFVLLPDDVIDAEVPLCQQMLDIFSKNNKPIVAVMEVPWDQVHRYGIVKARPLSEKIGDVQSIVEKPIRTEAPSNLAVIGRYLLPKTIFQYVSRDKPAPQQDVELTDALQILIPHTGLNSYLFSGERFDTGAHFGLLSASIAMALKDERCKDSMVNLIKILASSL